MWRATTSKAEPLPREVLRAAGIVAITTGLAALARDVLHVQDVEMLFLLGVMATAVTAGRRAAVIAAALSVGVFDWLFVPPFYTLDVADPRYITTFATMFVVSLVIGTLVLRLREQREAADSRASRLAALHDASRSFSGALDVRDVALATCRGAAAALSAEVAWIEVRGEAVAGTVAAEPSTSEVGAVATALAELVAAHGGTAGLGTSQVADEPILCVAVSRLDRVAAVLAVRPRDGRAPSAEQRALVEALAQGAALAMDRVHHAEEARRAALHAEREALRSQLLSSVSHDLRTPLATITGSATALREDPALDPATRRELIDSIVDEAERLERLVGNLLDMTRLDQGAVTPKREWVPADEVVGSALTRLERSLAGRPVQARLDANLPLLSVDPVLMEQLFVNLLENAVKYTPPGSEIAIEGHRTRDALSFEVADRGPGFEAGEEERIFERFQRGGASAGRGVGLGLPIARAIARVHGGQLTAANREGGGAVFRLLLPIPAGEPVTPGVAVASAEEHGDDRRATEGTG